MSTKDDKKDSYSPLIILCIVILIIWLLSIYIMKDNADRGTWGDMFGGVNALFSGFAFAGLIFTILLQKKELGLQREELRETRKEFISQNDTLRKQRFENTFFNLLNLHHEIVTNLTLNEYSEIKSGRSLIKKLKDTLISNLGYARADKDRHRNIIPNKRESNNLTEETLFIEQGYSTFWEEYDYLLSHYYRNLYHIFKFIYTTELIEENDKHLYASIVRAQLSPSELCLIFYNSMLTGYGNPNFLYLIKEYDILQNYSFNDAKHRNKELFDKLIKDVNNPFENE